MTDERKKKLAHMVKRKADVILDGTGNPNAIPQLMSAADERLTEEDMDFIIEESVRLARASSPR